MKRGNSSSHLYCYQLSLSNLCSLDASIRGCVIVHGQFLKPKNLDHSILLRPAQTCHYSAECKSSHVWDPRVQVVGWDLSSNCGKRHPTNLLCIERPQGQSARRWDALKRCEARR